MLTKEDLQAISEMMNVIIESRIDPKFQLLAEGQQAIREQLVPVSRIEALEDDVVLLKQAVRALKAELDEMKNAV